MSKENEAFHFLYVNYALFAISLRKAVRSSELILGLSGILHRQFPNPWCRADRSRFRFIICGWRPYISVLFGINQMKCE